MGKLTVTRHSSFLRTSDECQHADLPPGVTNSLRKRPPHTYINCLQTTQISVTRAKGVRNNTQTSVTRAEGVRNNTQTSATRAEGARNNTQRGFCCKVFIISSKPLPDEFCGKAFCYRTAGPYGVRCAVRSLTKF